MTTPHFLGPFSITLVHSNLPKQKYLSTGDKIAGSLFKGFTVHVVFFVRNFDSLIPDAPELIQTFLEGEADPSCKRNAFMMLLHVDRVRCKSPCDGYVTCFHFRIVLWII